MKLTIERILLLVIIGLLLYSWFDKDNTGEQLLMNQNKVLEQQIDSVKQKITLLNQQLESVKKDTVTIIKNYFKEIYTADSLIQIDSSNANRIIRYELDERKTPIEKYPTIPLTNYELVQVGYKLIDYNKTKATINNYMEREIIYEMELIEKDKVIELQAKQLNNLQSIIKEIRPAWYDNFVVGAGTAVLVTLGIIVATN